jgi:SAM-dependent MidA family methyltransferase
VTLREKIVQEIRERGPVSFSRYMEMCLYDPELGYYSRNAEQFGKAGDFYTSSDVHAVFGRLLARQFEEMWRALGCPERIEIIELGPGRGLFARDVLDWSEKTFSEFFRALHYSLVETSPALRMRLQATLGERIAAKKASFCEAQNLPERYSSSAVIVFANEFFDALPVEVVSRQGKLHIGEQQGRFFEIWLPASALELEFLDRYGVHPEAGERVEASLIGQRTMAEIAESVRRGFVIAIDYGYTRQEQLSGRHHDTLMTYRRHSGTADPYHAPGDQDITAHVNFTALAAAAEKGGMQVQTLHSQSNFLLGIGEKTQFADVFQQCRLPQEHAKVALQLKHLIAPAGMGESFQVLVASKGVNFSAVEGLSGLSFGKNRESGLLRDVGNLPRV